MGILIKDKIINSDIFGKTESQLLGEYHEIYNKITQYDINKMVSPSNRILPQEEMSIGDLYQLLITENQKEHEKTRSVVKEETGKIKNDIIACIQDNPVETIELLSKITLICALFSLAVWWIIDFSIINPFFSLFLIFSSLAGIGMSKIRRATLNKGE